jgi:hypothetical protein
MDQIHASATLLHGKNKCEPSGEEISCLYLSEIRPQFLASFALKPVATLTALPQLAL